MHLVSDLREATWGYLQSKLSGMHTPEHYRGYDRDFLDHFLAAANGWPFAKPLATTPLPVSSR
jgi:hypothetical protein